MRPLSSLGSAAVLVVTVIAGSHRAEAQPDWKVAAAEVCPTKHSYRFYQRMSSTFELGTAGPNDAIEENVASFAPQTGKAQSRSVWKKVIGTTEKPWQDLTMVATCAADPWLFPKSVAKCGSFQAKGTCANQPSCTPPSGSPPFRVPAGVFREKPLAPSGIPHPKIVAPGPDQASMVLEVPAKLEEALPTAAYCAVMSLTATGPGGATVTANWPVADGSARGTLSFVGRPLGKWTLTATPRQYTGKPGSDAWTAGPPESRGFYVGPSWPGSKDKPVSVTMLKIVSPAKGASLPPKSGALTISIHEDLRDAANPKRVSLTWQYVESPLPGVPWPGQSVLPDVVELLPQLKSPSAPDQDWLNYHRTLDFAGQTSHKSWKLHACVRAYDTDLCQETPFLLAGP